MAAPIRLQREMPAARQAGGAMAIGAVLAVLGGGILFVARSVTPGTGEGEWLAYIVGAGFLLVGMVMLFLGLKMSLITRLPETIVELDRTPLRAGQPFRVTVRQPGPIRLASLRVNLVAEQVTRYETWRKGKKRIETDRYLVHQDNVLDVQDLVIARGDEFTSGADVNVPTEIKLVDIEGRTSVAWRLEVWGRVRGWVNFGHPFAITVTGVRAAVDAEPGDN